MNIRDIVTRLAIPAVVALFLMSVAISKPVFFSWENLSNVLLQASIIGIIAIGMTPVIIGGGIDLSVGSVAALAAIILAITYGYGYSALPATILALLVGLGCGVANGVAVSFFGIPSFIATLGMMGLARGLALLSSGGQPLSDIGSISRFLGEGNIIGVPMPVIIFAIVGVLLYVFLRRSVGGTHLYAIGGNARAAWISGVDIRAYVAGTYVFCGLLASLAGITVAGRLGSAQPLAGNLYELDSITAAVLGGGSLSGGKGSALGTAAGAVLLAAIRNAMVLMDLSPYLHQIVIGMVLISVFLADSIRKGGKDPLKNGL